MNKRWFPVFRFVHLPEGSEAAILVVVEGVDASLCRESAVFSRIANRLMTYNLEIRSDIAVLRAVRKLFLPQRGQGYLGLLDAEG